MIFSSIDKVGLEDVRELLNTFPVFRTRAFSCATIEPIVPYYFPSMLNMSHDPSENIFQTGKLLLLIFAYAHERSTLLLLTFYNQIK